jgi:hypothetical protein
MPEPDREPQCSEPSEACLTGRASPKAWDHVELYIITAMTIPQLHKRLESVLGLAVFKDDVGFWNSVITDVTVDNNNEEAAMRTYTSLRKRYVVSIYCANSLNKQTN